MSKKPIFIGAAAIGALVVGASGYFAIAVSAIATFPSRDPVVAECLVTTPEGIDFDSMGFLASSVDPTAMVDVQCTNTTPYNKSIDNGTTTENTTIQTPPSHPVIIAVTF